MTLEALRHPQVERLQRRVAEGDLDAARELFAIARRQNDMGLWTVAARLLLAHGCWCLQASGAAAAPEDETESVVRFDRDIETGMAVLAWGATNRWDPGESYQGDELAGYAAELAVREVLGRRGDAEDALWPGPTASREQLATYLASRVVAAERAVAEHAAAWERAGGTRPRRGWLPQRRRRRRARRRHVRAWAGIVVAGFVRDEVVVARFGTGEAFLISGPRMRCLTAPHGESRLGGTSPRANLNTELEPRRPEVADVLTVHHPVEPGDRLLLVGPGFAVVRDLLSTPRLLDGQSCDVAAARIVETWARVASSRARSQARRQPCCVVADIIPDGSVDVVHPG